MEEIGTQPSLSESSSDEECLSPRIGSEYQVDEVPPCTHSFIATTDSAIDETDLLLAIGLPVAVTTTHLTNVQKQDFARKGTAEAECTSSDAIKMEEYTKNIKSEEYTKNAKGKNKGKKKRKANWMSFRRIKAKASDQSEESIVPGDSFHPWEECEEAAFVLGLYLFGKDFNAIKRFVETRTLSDLQQYYYGTFFGTAAYKRWFAARHSCSKRIVNGHHILAGWRQEELLRRLLPELKECSRPELYQAVTEFNKGDVTFENYVSKIKELAGLELLVDSVGLGCGKRDLTAGPVDNAQAGSSNRKFELPQKAFSDYTASEMFRALSGGCRLSKTRAQDLFWEGVWPRLLAKGWSSEQSGKGPLVYMVPGIKRYSKRSLTKGKDYFDSINDVLNHISKDCTLLELPELDSELIAKTDTLSIMKREEKNGAVTGDKKRRPTLWLSRESKVLESVKKKKKNKPEEDAQQVDSENQKIDSGDLNIDAEHLKVDPEDILLCTEQMSEESTEKVEDILEKGEVNSNEENSMKSEEGHAEKGVENAMGMRNVERLASYEGERVERVVRNESDSGNDVKESCTELRTCDNGTAVLATGLTRVYGDYQIIKRRKRSYYDTFSSMQLGVTVSAQCGASEMFRALSGGCRFFLENGKSMRMYGKTTLEPYRVFLRGFQEVVNHKGDKFSTLSLYVAYHQQPKRIENRVCERGEQGKLVEYSSGISLASPCENCGEVVDVKTLHECRFR